MAILLHLSSYGFVVLHLVVAHERHSLDLFAPTPQRASSSSASASLYLVIGVLTFAAIGWGALQVWQGSSGLLTFPAYRFE